MRTLDEELAETIRDNPERADVYRAMAAEVRRWQVMEALADKRQSGWQTGKLRPAS